MCGIVGLINKSKFGFNKAELDAFELMLFMDTLRGDDSTGVFLVTNDGSVQIAKEVGDGANFLRSKEWQAMRSKAFTSGWAIIGHNRKATKGSVTDENAHPFWDDDKIVLVHNGSLWNHKQIADTEVDSHAICKLLAREPDHEAALQQLNGAFALVWYDVEPQNLHLVRNDQRPLSHTANHNAWFISSEKSIMDFALTRAGVQKLEYEPVSFPDGNLHCWHLNHDKSGTLTHKKVELTKKISISCGWQGVSDSESAWEEYFRERHGTQEYATVLKPEHPEFKAFVEKRVFYNFEKGVEYSAWTKMRETTGELTNNLRVRVSVEDWENAELPGFTRVVGDYRGFLVVFLVEEALFERAVNNHESTELAFDWYVTIDNHRWFSAQQAGEADSTLGYPALWAVNAEQCVIYQV